MMNLFTKRMIGALLLVAAAALAAIHLLENDTTASVLETIEARGSRVLGTRVDVSGAQVDWDAGDLSLSGLVVANPGGFSNQDMISVDKIDVQLDPGTRVIREIALHGVRAVVEFRGSRSNFETMNRRVAGNAAASPAADDMKKTESPAGDSKDAHSGGGEGVRDDWRIERISMDGIRVSIQADWTSKVFETETDGLVLESLDAGADDLARAVVTRFMYKALATAARQVDDRRLKQILESKASELRGRPRGES